MMLLSLLLCAICPFVLLSSAVPAPGTGVTTPHTDYAMINEAQRIMHGGAGHFFFLFFFTALPFQRL